MSKKDAERTALDWINLILVGSHPESPFNMAHYSCLVTASKRHLQLAYGNTESAFMRLFKVMTARFQRSCEDYDIGYCSMLKLASVSCKVTLIIDDYCSGVTG